jgi:hypothetical protein
MASHDWWPHVRRLEVPALLRAIAWFARVARGTINHLGGRGHPSWDAAGRGGLATEPEPGRVAPTMPRGRTSPRGGQIRHTGARA